MQVFKYHGQIQPQKPTVLLLAGGMTSPAIFDEIAKQLPVQYAQIDWLSSPGPWDPVTVGKKLYRFIVEQDLGPTVLVGYSASGPICMQAALEDQTGRIAGLALNNTGLNTNNHGDPKAPQKILDHWGDIEYHQQFINRCFAFPVKQDLNARLLQYILKMDKQAAYEASYCLRQIDLLPQAQAINCPVLIIHGLLDKARTVEHALIMKELLPNASLYFLQGGHSIFVEAEKEYLFLLQAFLQQLNFIPPSLCI